MQLRHAAPSPSQLPDSLHRLAKEQRHRPPDFLSGHAYEREVTESRRLLAGGGSCSRDLWRAWKSRHCRSAWCSENRGRARAAWRGKITSMVCFLDYLRAFGINADQCTTAAPDEGEWRKTAGQGAERFMAKLIAEEKASAGLLHAVV